jgi:AraC-like DNA-binding protein
LGGERAKCEGCDKEACGVALEKKSTHIYKCRYGLTEAVSPLYNFGSLSGFLMMGQVYCDESEPTEARERLAGLLEDAECAARLADKIPRVRADMLRSYVKIMTICAQYLTLSNSIPAAKPSTAELAKKYISENIDKKFGIGDICRELKCSKSTLLTTFKRKYGITVNTHITETRLSQARYLLADGEKSINEIAAETGFSDQSYFSKVFSAKYGMPPSEYRAEINRSSSKA